MNDDDRSALVRLASEALEVEVVPAIGARLHRLRAFGQDLLRTPHDLRPHVDDPYFYGSYPMAPWCNRLPTGPATVAGRAVDLPASFPDGTAIHGQVSRRPWTVIEAGPADATFRIGGGGDGWPWPYDVEQRVRIDDARLGLALRLTNRSDGPMPGGIGFHPWWRSPVLVRIAAATVHPDNHATDALPVPVAGQTDRRRLEEMPEGLDGTWADLSDPPVVLAWPASGIRATMTFTAPTRFVTAARLAGTDAIAVEPQTHAPDGLRRLLRGEPGALALLPAGGSLELEVEIAFERAADGSRTASQT
jgi:aldose 1-epimerase